MCTILTRFIFTESRGCHLKGGREHIKKHQKCQEFIKILILISLKSSLQNPITFGIFLIFDNIGIYSKYIWECRRGGGVLPPIQSCSPPIKPVSQWTIPGKNRGTPGNSKQNKFHP